MIVTSGIRGCWLLVAGYRPGATNNGQLPATSNQ
jgi:hypothetical protein